MMLLDMEKDDMNGLERYVVDCLADAKSQRALAFFPMHRAMVLEGASDAESESDEDEGHNDDDDEELSEHQQQHAGRQRQQHRSRHHHSELDSRLAKMEERLQGKVAVVAAEMKAAIEEVRLAVLEALPHKKA